MNKKYKKSWKSLPHIAKLTISNKFWDEPYTLGRIDDHISFTVAKTPFHKRKRFINIRS